MNPDDDAAHRKIRLAVAATETGAVLFSGSDTSTQFDRGCDHVCALLRDAYTLFTAGSFPTAVFLSITAIEEIAKLEIAAFRQPGLTVPAKRRSDDHLYSHKLKHAIALQEVIAIGTRLPAAIGEARVRELLDMSESGGLVALRESSLYAENVDGQFLCPHDRIDRALAREMLLLALEVWDDRLVGLSNHTYALDGELVAMFEAVARP
ncbi:AbiV family abortive infection protein [Variovorax boronicumulans]|uniref:AbiV family abortive infection protein n=1 Tax=Variovorax boronicumulans TaxID=436515 RepID=UPI0012E5F93A|nr:AbiV family abortive infection protein [Variovorax boronicumulans]GER09472.1 hypothetical protein VHAB30_06240 [Variovorax boronicumulans]